MRRKSSLPLALAWVALVLVLLLLDAAALHDVLVREPDLRAEWAMLAGSVVIFGAFGLWLWRQRRATG